MNPLWLMLIVPASAMIGMFASSFASISKISDLQLENMQLREKIGDASQTCD